MLGFLKVIKVKRSNLEVLRDQVQPGTVALGETDYSVSVTWDSKLLRDQEELHRVHAQRETLKADLVLNLLALYVDERAVSFALSTKVSRLEVARCVRVVAGTETVFAITALDGHPVRACVVDQIHLLVALTKVESTSVEEVQAKGDIDLVIET